MTYILYAFMRHASYHNKMTAMTVKLKRKLKQTERLINHWRKDHHIIISMIYLRYPQINIQTCARATQTVPCFLETTALNYHHIKYDISKFCKVQI
jgi:hypothetical protein